MKPLLSVIIPAYNTESTIERAVNSILRRKSPLKVEVLIVNDGSNDNTKAICKKIIKNNTSGSTEIILHNKPNGGHGSVINYGIKACRGKYFKVLDGDDELDGSALDSLLKKLDSSESDLIMSDYYEKRDSSKTLSEWSKLKEFDDKLYKNIITKTSNTILPCATVKTSLLKESGYIIDEKCYYDDQEYDFLVITNCKTVSYLKKPVYVYHLGNPNQSVAINGFIKNIKSHEKVCLRLIEDYHNIEESLPDSLRSYIYNEMLIKLSHQQYRIAIYMKKSRKDFLDFDKKLKKYPAIYNDYRVAGRKIKLHRLTRGVLI